MENYLPEGMAAERKTDLRELGAGGVFCARVLRCTPEHDLIVRLECGLGLIERSEAALESGREIAILSRVGRNVCFTVKSLSAPEGFAALLSRCEAQALAFERLRSLPDGEVIPAQVTHLAPFGAFVDVGCGISSMIGVENISAARIRSPADRFKVGWSIKAVRRSCEGGRVFLSHKELLGTWEQNAELFRCGETVAGTVRGVKDYGVFIELRPNLSGLAEYRAGLGEGDRVAVYIKAIIPEKRKIKLVIIDALPPQKEPEPPEYFITEGNVSGWEY